MRWSVFITAFFISISFVAVAHSATLRTVALSGQPAPGTPGGVSYSSLDSYYAGGPFQIVRGPVLNDVGRTAFRAHLTGAGVDATNNQGIWSEGSGSLALVARTGSAAPGAPDGVNFGLNPALELFTPLLNSAGQTAFYGGLTDGSVGIWSEGSGSLALVARDGIQAPGTPAGVNHSFAVVRDFLWADLPKLNNAGQTAFWANVTGNGVDNTNDWGVWSEGSGSLALVARSGSPAPGAPESVNYDSFFIQSGFNDAGQTAFFAYLTGSGVDPSNDQGIWSERTGSLTLLARSGSPAPGTPGGVNFREFSPPVPTVAINNAGQTAFKAFLTGDGVDETNDEGLWSEGSGTLALVARRGSPAPGTPRGVNFGAFGLNLWPLLNDAGQTAFRADLTGTGVTSTNSRGIWSGGTDDLKLVARTGDPAPGTSSGIRFSDLVRPTLNSAGQIAFGATLTGTGVLSSNNTGIWATDQAGTLQLIARTGAQVEVVPADFRTISDLLFVGDTGNSDGRASGFNNSGQLVFWARFTNGTQGVFVSNLVANLQVLPGDYNKNGIVDTADYTVWRDHLGTSFDLNFNGNETGTSAGVVDQADYDLWKAHFGEALGSGSAARSPSSAAVPEPPGVLLTTIGFAALILKRWRRACELVNRSSLASGRLYMVLALAAGVGMQVAPVITAQGTTIEFDSTAKSPAVIPFDPNASFEGRVEYVSGRIPTNVKGPIVGGTNINTLVGADAFYSHGFTGTNAVIANIEAGHIWNGHETLTHVLQIPNHPSALNEFDRHATQVGMILAGRRAGLNPGAYQEGMAPNAQLYSGAIATQWNGPRYFADLSTLNSVTFDQYRKAFNMGVNGAGRQADVINSSWGPDVGANGSDTLSIALDGFANTNPRTLFVVAAGNDGAGPNTVLSPASAYNNMSVAALGPNSPYDRVAILSSGGPNDYADPVNGTKNKARQTVDIAAPGQNLSSAYYGGETGGNGTTDNPAVSGPGPTGLPYGSLGGPDFYSRGGLTGTSYAAPTVAGGAALLYDAAYSVFPSNEDARDARVMKAVLMNSADKTVGWNNGQIAHPNGNGGVLTTQGLDNRVGTGRLNLQTAYEQFLTGTTDIAGIASGSLGLVNDIGWDFGQVVSGTTNDYYFNSSLDGGSTLTATLTWFRDRQINANNTVFDDSYDNLDLELWSVIDGTPASLISESRSLYNESEHFSFALPDTGDYALRVRWLNEVFDRVADANQESYGLAWWAGPGLETMAVPEPASAVLLATTAMVLGISWRVFRRCRPDNELAIQGPIFR
jgi:hypothetical protein